MFQEAGNCIVNAPSIDERIIPNDWAGSVAVDAAGNVVAGGQLQDTPLGLGRCSENGSILCRSDRPCTNEGAGVCEPSPLLAEEFAVIKFAGADGRELWRGTFSDPEPGRGAVNALALDPSGDVVAAGERGISLAVAKFSGATGAELWRYEARGTAPPPANMGTRQQNYARALALDRAGDVFAVGQLNNEDTRSSFAVIKLSGDSGAELWRREVDTPRTGRYTSDEARSVAIDSSGNVVVAGELAQKGAGFAVIKFAGSDGSELWRFAQGGSGSGYYLKSTVEIEPSGDVLTASRSGGFSVFRLSGTNGQELWRSSIGGTGVPYYDRVAALTLDPQGNPVVAGAVHNAYGTEDFMVARLEAADGTGATGILDKHPIPGQSLQVFGEGKRRLILSSVSRGKGYYGANEPGILAPYRTSRANPTKSGATLEIINPWWTESHTISLPASNWKELGRRRFRGYLYRDRHGEVGPCTRILLTNGKFLKISCRGEGIGLSLGDRQQHMLLVQLTFGTDARMRHFAFLAPTSVVKDTPKVFSARHAPALDSYPGIWPTP